MATTSTTPITVQQIALPRSPANQKPLAALKQRMALVHPLTNAPGLLNISRIFMESFYDRLVKNRDFTHPVKEDVKKKSLSRPLAGSQGW